MAVTPTGRIHRDAPLRRGDTTDVPAAPPGSPEALLSSGHFALRFPHPLEAEFAADTLEPRRRLLAGCALMSFPGVLIGTVNIDQIAPEISGQVWDWVGLWTAVTLLSLIALWFMPAPRRRIWHGEAFTMVMATLLSLLLTWMPTVSRTDTAFTHSSLAAIPVMYICIAARQRFYWALAGTAIAFLSYALFVRGTTPLQQLLVDSNLRLMAMSFAFTLVANYAFEHRERRNWLLRRLARQQRAALLDTTYRLQLLAVQDPLTGLSNRRHFDAMLSSAWAEAHADDSPLSLLVVDVDFFKPYNDTRGHPAGDACLNQLAAILTDITVAEGGTVARLGGEEFGIVLPGKTLARAITIADNICGAVLAAQIPHGASAVSPFVTVSVGAAQALPAAHGSEQHLQEAADRALYRAKHEGRNRVAMDIEALAADATAVKSSTPAKAPLEAAPASEAPSTQEAVLIRILESGIRWLRFPAAQERRYIKERAPARRRHIALMSVLGLSLYGMYVYVSQPMFPDISTRLVNTQLMLIGIMAVVTLLNYLRSTSITLRERLSGLGAVILGLLSTWVLSHSQLMSTLNHAASLAFIPMFAGIALRLPFWITCVPALTTCAAAAWLLTPLDAVQRLVYYDTLFTIVANTVFTLILAYTLEHGTRKEWLLSQVDKLQREALETAKQRLQRLSLVDPLTGINNRRQLEDDLNRLWEECLQDQRPLAMLIIDVDHFKLYNDSHGHPQGDRCLKQIANIIQQTAHTDKGLAARLGGEEFGILLPGARTQQAARLGEQVCQAVRDATIEHRHTEAGHVTVSIGVASVRPSSGVARMVLLASADQALYEAKRAGRDKVITQRQPYQPAPPPSV